MRALSIFSSQQRVLRPFALGQQRQRLARDIGLEVVALLVRLEGGLVAEQFVEQELRRVILGARDQEQLRAFLALGLGQEAGEDVGDAVGFARLGLPLRDNQQATARDGLADVPFHCIVRHDRCSLRFAVIGQRLPTPDRCQDNSIADE